MTTRKKQPKRDNKEQSDRFIEKAEQIQSDNAEEAFGEAISKIAKKKRVFKKT